MILNLATDLPLLFCSVKLNLSMVPQQVRPGNWEITNSLLYNRACVEAVKTRIEETVN